MRPLGSTAAFLLCAALFACGDDGSAADGGARDSAAPMDAGAVDSDAPIDASADAPATPDSATLDASIADAGPRPECTAMLPATDTGEVLGAFELIAGQFYVVHSGLSGASDSRLRNTSNIYVIKGTADAGGTAVWLFGSGYGDPDSDLDVYRDFRVSAARDAAADIADVDMVIRGCMGVTRAETRIRFVAPHFHLDHINSEIFIALEALGYDSASTRILIHELDFAGATCNTFCCGMDPCSGGGAGFGAPYLPAWTSAMTDRMQSIGTAGDACGDTVMSFDGAETGAWTLRLDGAHTPGSINLDNDALSLRIMGSAADTCSGGAANVIRIHGAVGYTGA